MSNDEKEIWLNLDSIIEDQLNLQVTISYDRHHEFMIKNGLTGCKKVLDLGTGNGLFLRKLAIDHPNIEFVGVDKRPHFIERCNSTLMQNVSSFQLDIQEDNSNFDFGQYDGIVMRYFLLHVPNAKEILKKLLSKLKKKAHLWVIDVDLSDFQCVPQNSSFELLGDLFHEFCSKNSIDTFAGQNLGPIFNELGFKNIIRLADPFSTKNTPIEQMVRFLKQETICYSQMNGRIQPDKPTVEVLNFIDSKVKTREVDISYGMILWHAST